MSKTTETIFTNAIALAVIPAYIYLCSYQYELGMCKFYDIPKYLIKPDLSLNLHFAIILFAIVFIVYVYPHYIFNIFFWERIVKNHALIPFYKNNLLIFCALLLFAILTEFPTLIIISLSLGLLVFANLISLMQYRYLKKELVNRDYKTIATDWNNVVNIPIPIIEAPDVLNLKSLFTNVRQKHIVLIMALTFILILSYFIGEKNAETKIQYEISSDKINHILLKKYGDDLIIKSYDPTTNKIGDSLILSKIGPTNSFTFVRKKIGRLKNASHSNFYWKSIFED